MALVGYTEADLQNFIHSMYEGDTDTPDSTDDDYLYRRRLLNLGINRWENDKGILWNELWANTSGSDATTTVADGTTDYGAPSDIRFPGGYVKILDSDGGTLKRLTVVKPEQIQQYPSDTSEICYFRGSNADGFTLVISSGIAETYNGKTLGYDYYKRATALSSTSAAPEMSDPMFLVYGAVAELYKQDNNVAFYTAHLREAEERLKQMEVVNMMNTHYQGIENEDLTQSVIGE